MGARTVLVVGAGAAGLTAALRAGQAGARVTLLNAHPRVGLKILMSGGTRCNVTHREVSERDYHGGSTNVVRRVLRAFTPAQTVEWFQDELGVPLKLEETGKYFPVSDDAQTVLDALLAATTQVGVELRSGAPRRAAGARREAVARRDPTGPRQRRVRRGHGEGGGDGVYAASRCAGGVARGGRRRARDRRALVPAHR
jgi:predicted flavoprotein YhiN